MGEWSIWEQEPEPDDLRLILVVVAVVHFLEEEQGEAAWEEEEVHRMWGVRIIITIRGLLFPSIEVVVVADLSMGEALVEECIEEECHHS